MLLSLAGKKGMFDFSTVEHGVQGCSCAHFPCGAHLSECSGFAASWQVVCALQQDCASCKSIMHL